MHVGNPLCTCHVQNEEMSVLKQFQYLGNYWADCAESWHVGRHPLGNAYPCATSWGAAARAHVQGSILDLENGWTDCAEMWYMVRNRLEGCSASQLGPILHVRTCRVSLPDLKNGLADCAQIWYIARDLLVGCRAQISWDGINFCRLFAYNMYILFCLINNNKRHNKWQLF